MNSLSCPHVITPSLHFLTRKSRKTCHKILQKYSLLLIVYRNLSDIFFLYFLSKSITTIFLILIFYAICYFIFSFLLAYIFVCLSIFPLSLSLINLKNSHSLFSSFVYYSNCSFFLTLQCSALYLLYHSVLVFHYFFFRF